MRRQTMAQATLVMVVVGFVTKVLGMANRIVITRSLGESGVGVYMLISPTVMLLATLATIGLPVAIPALVSRGELKEGKILSTSFIITIVLSGVISVIMFFAAEPISVHVLKDGRTMLPLMMIGPLLFVVSFTAILKSYFQGKQNMTPGALSTLAEQVVRMGLSIVFIAWLLPRGIEYAVVGLMLASIAGELVSAIILLGLFLRFKKQHYPRSSLMLPKLAPVNFKDVLGISLPTTGSRLIGTLTHFLEPIIVVRILFMRGYASEASTAMYGAVSGFAIPLLFMPSFISSAVTQAIIPAIGRSYREQNFEVIRARLSTAFKVAFVTSGLYMMLVMVFPYEIMELLYHSTTGAEFLLVMAPIFLLLYFQAPLVAVLQAIGEAKFALHASLISSAIKIGTMTALMLIPGVNIWGLVISILVNIVVLTSWYYVIVAKRIGYRLNAWKVTNGVLILGIVYVLGRYLSETLVFNSQLVHVVVIGLILLVVHGILANVSGMFPKESR